MLGSASARQASPRESTIAIKGMSMHMQISAGCNITGDPRALAQPSKPSYATTAGGSSMIEQHLFEKSATSSGVVDKRCLFKVCLAGQQPFITWDVAGSDSSRRQNDAPVGRSARKALAPLDAV